MESWSIDVPECAPSEIRNELRRAFDNQDSPAPGGWSDETKSQVAAAIQAAGAIAPSVGGSKITATLVGDSNPGHQASGERPNDTVTITVHQLA